jgi:hypothetical protein
MPALPVGFAITSLSFEFREPLKASKSRLATETKDVGADNNPPERKCAFWIGLSTAEFGDFRGSLYAF